jgi:hypothetical protein
MPCFSQLGDRIEKALALAGITEEKVTIWIGRPCGCKERKEKLNQLGNWAQRVVKGKIENAEKYLNKIIGAKNGE